MDVDGIHHEQQQQQQQQQQAAPNTREANADERESVSYPTGECSITSSNSASVFATASSQQTRNRCYCQQLE